MKLVVVGGVAAGMSIAARARRLDELADIVVFDPELRLVIRADKLHQNVDYTPYEGMVVDGWPVLVMSRGDVIVEDMQLHAAAGRGAFLRCGKPDPARPKPPRVTEAPVRLG